MSDNNKENQIDKDVAVILLLADNKSFKTEDKSYDLKVFGKSMKSWVKMAVGDCKVTEVKASMSDGVVTLVKPHLSNKKYIDKMKM